MKTFLIGRKAAFAAAFLFTAGMLFAAPNEASLSNDDEARYRSTVLFANVLELIRDEYADPSKIDYETLTYSALRGMTDALDPHTQFLRPDEYQDMQEETQGTFGGIGASVGMSENRLTVNVPLEGTPAFQAGLIPGDQIVKINGEVTKDWSLSDAIEKLRGEPGTQLTLTIYRASAEKKFKEFTLTRELIDVPTVYDTKILPGTTFGYIRLTQFGDGTVEEFENALEELQKKKMTGLILDLRHNPGGLLESAVEIAGKFLPTGTVIVSTEGRLGKASRTLYYSPGHQRILDLPLVLLINGSSASGSEIVAGALKDFRRAVLIGETTFGKGSVQTVQPVEGALDKPVALRLTTALYYTPAKKLIHQKGVEPDIYAPIVRQQERDLFLKRSLALLSEEERQRVEKTEDEQLQRAIQVLRGLETFSQRKHIALLKPE